MRFKVNGFCFRDDESRVWASGLRVERFRV